MSTNDVPGFKAHNSDQLHAGCWGEHEDGSLILVGSIREGDVRYLAVNPAQTPPVVYIGSMAEPEFKTRFSAGGDCAPPWVWHDKTPFVWSNQVIGGGVMTGESAEKLGVALGLQEYRMPEADISRVLAAGGVPDAPLALA